MGFTGCLFYIDEECPELIEYFVNREDAHCASHSHSDVMLRCPCCGKTYISTPYKLFRNLNKCCDSCSDGISYPEKMMMAILNQLGVEYDRQYSPEWANKYKYDFEFTFNGIDYIIEMDGELGHGHKVHAKSKRTAEELVEIDRKKDALASEHGFTLIRIDCAYKNKNRLNYIKTQCTKELGYIFDLSNIDWQECHKSATNSLIRSVIDVYNSGNKVVNNIAEIVHIKPRTVIKYLLEAMANEIIPKEPLIITLPNVSCDVIGKLKTSYKYVYCYEDNICFVTMREAADYYNYDYGSFRYFTKAKFGVHFNKHFSLVSSDDDISEFRKLIFDNCKPKIIYQYSKDGNLINKYCPPYNFPNGFKYQSILQNCNKRRKTMYGYIWSYSKIA